MAWKWKKSFPPWPLRNGQKEFGQGNGIMNKKKRGLETSERTGRAVMCETRDLGIKWPHWHTLILSGETRIDMRCVPPRDVKKMLVQRTRSVY